MTSCLLFLHTKPPSRKWSPLKGKNLLLRGIVDPFQKGGKTNVAVLAPLKVYPFSLRRMGISGPEVILLFSCSTQLSMNFSLLINIKMPTIVSIFIFISRDIFMLSYV